MADTKISGLTAASALDGTEEFAANQGGTSKKVTATQVKTFAGVQVGVVSSGTLVAATNKTVSVTFPTAFSSAPKVTVSPSLGSEATAVRRCSVVDGSETTTGFQINFWRDTGTATFNANWIAAKP